MNSPHLGQLGDILADHALGPGRFVAHLGVISFAALLAGSCATNPPSPPAAPGPAAPSSGADAAEPPEEPAEAIRFFEARVARNPTDVGAWHRLTSQLRRANRLQEAARAGWRAVELAPTWESWTNLGNVLMQGRAPRCLRGVRDGVRQGRQSRRERAQFPEPPATRTGRSATRTAPPTQSTAPEKASPQNPQVFYDRATLLSALGKADEAKRAAQRALELLAPVDAGKLPTESARNAVTTMRALLERTIAGEKAHRPTIDTGTTLLPERFYKDDIAGHALALAIDEKSFRVYPAGPNHVFRVEVPSRWTETARIDEQQTYVKLMASDAPPRAAIQMTALVTRDKDFDLQQATEKGAQVVREGGGIVEPIQPAGKASLLHIGDGSQRQAERAGRIPLSGSVVLANRWDRGLHDVHDADGFGSRSWHAAEAARVARRAPHRPMTPSPFPARCTSRLSGAPTCRPDEARLLAC